MEYKAQFNQSDLILKISQHYDKSLINLDKWERYLDILCSSRLYQKEAIKTAVIYLASGKYNSLEDLVDQNYDKSYEIQKKYSSKKDYIKSLQLGNKLYGTIDLATGTGKSYVMFAIAQILLAEGIVKRVLVLCPTLTIESGLMDKFITLASDPQLRDAIPQDLVGTLNPEIISANTTITEGSICIENIHSVYENTGSSIKDSFKNGGSDTLVLNDEAHHIFNFSSDKSIKKWKLFLTNKEYNFKYMLGLTGTAYIDNDYFNDVIYRYSLNQAIDDGVVKTIDYVQKDDIGSNREYKFQKIYENHERNKLQFSKIKPLSIMITKDIKRAEILMEEFLDFLVEFEGIDIEKAREKVLIVTSKKAHQANVAMLPKIDSKEISYEWIVSVSMLTEGWDVKNVFQIVPWEDRAFNSKLLISQVLGRGLRLPEEYSSPQPSVTVFNHDSWSKNIQSLVEEVLEIETRIISTVKFEGERNKYNFVVKHLNYDKEEKEIDIPHSGKEINYEKVWNEGIKLKSQTIVVSKETEFENLVTGIGKTRNYDIKLRTRSVDEVVKKIADSFSRIDWESKIIGLGDDVVYNKENKPPKEKIKKIIKTSMEKAGIEGDVLIEENANRIFAAFSTLFRGSSKTVTYSVKSTETFDLDTSLMRDESRGLSTFRIDSTLFYSNEYEKEMPNEEQLQTMETFLADENFPKKSTKVINFYDFKTPVNVVFTSRDPEFQFVNKYLTKHENASKIEAWIKSRDMGFYGIQYSYTVSSHTKQSSFNPDFIIKLKSSKYKNLFVVVEIKSKDDVSIENKGKNKAAKSHFKTLNKKLEKEGKNEKYLFHFLSSEDYQTFFEYLRGGKIENFRSGLDLKLENGDA